MTQQSLYDNNPSLFEHSSVKNRFHADCYYIQIGNICDDKMVGDIAYWYGAWSHTRNDTWKGFLEICLSESDDLAAEDALKTLEAKL